MVLEATVICLDNSDWMRNGDYPPTRYQAQTDAVNLICGAKTQANPENTVGVLTMAGKGVRVLVTPTADLGKILSSMQGVEVGGQSNVLSSVQVAQLALKHRQNKNQRQRIVLFCGSPVAADVDTLVRIGKKLKKNNVALDIVSFGEEDGRKAEKLEALLAAVNSNDNSHLVQVPPGPAMLSDVLISSPIFAGDGEGGSGFAAAAAAGAAAAAAAGGVGGAFDFDVDPNLDPELALALRVSMEEERARQEAAAKKAADEKAAAAAAAAAAAGDGSAAAASGIPIGEAAGSVDAVMGDAAVAAAFAAASAETSRGDGAEPMEDEAALLQEALAMSLAEAAAEAEAAAPNTAAAVAETDPSRGSGAGAVPAEDDELALALQMSMDQGASLGTALPRPGTEANSAGALAAAAAAPMIDMGNPFGDADFVNSILATLPGVDPNDPSVKEALASLGGPRPKVGEGDAGAGASMESEGGEKKD